MPGSHRVQIQTKGERNRKLGLHHSYTGVVLQEDQFVDMILVAWPH